MPQTLIFDYDDTLANDDVLFPRVKEILEELHAAGHKLKICSFNLLVEQHLLDLQVRHLFTDIIPVMGGDKGQSIKDFCAARNINLATVLFFDDLIDNYWDAVAHRIPTVHVKVGGLTQSDVEVVQQVDRSLRRDYIIHTWQGRGR